MSKEAQRIRSRRWYLANRDLALARAKQQREENHETYLAYLKTRYNSIPPETRKLAAAVYHADNRDRDLARMAEYRDRDKEASRMRDAKKYQKRRTAALAHSAIYYVENSPLIKARVLRWAKANPIVSGATRRNYKARKRNASGSHTAQEISHLLKLQGLCCAICQQDLGNKWHVDHVMPLILGGSNDATNLQILCAHCNMSKGGKHPVEFARQRGILLNSLPAALSA